MEIGLGLGLTLSSGRLSLPPSIFVAGGAWWDPWDFTKLYSDSGGTTHAALNDPVGLIQDKSGNGNDLSQTTSSARPTLISSGAGYGLQFDGIDDCILALGTALNLFKNVSGAALFFAGSVSSVAPVNAPPMGFSIGTGSGARVALFQNTTTLRVGGRRLDADGFLSADATSQLAVSTPFVATGLFDFTNTTATLRKNGVQVAQNTSFQTSGSTSNTASQFGGVFQFDSSALGQGVFNGGVALPYLPSAQVIATIERFLARRASI